MEVEIQMDNDQKGEGHAGKKTHTLKTTAK